MKRRIDEYDTLFLCPHTFNKLRIEMKRRINEYDTLFLCPHTFNKVIPEVWLIKKKEGFSIAVSMTLRKNK